MRTSIHSLQVDTALQRFIDDEVLPGTGIAPADFWTGFDAIVRELAPKNAALLAERGRYVLAAAPFKRSADEVRAPQRVEQVVAKVRALAAEHGAMPDVVERIYRELIDAFTDAEHQRWQQR
jgi:chorismate mutase